jgi:hypothetical protein
MLMAAKRTDRITELATALRQELQVYVDGSPEEREVFARTYGKTLAPLLYMIDGLTKADRAKRESFVEGLRMSELANQALDSVPGASRKRKSGG